MVGACADLHRRVILSLAARRVFVMTSLWGAGLPSIVRFKSDGAWKRHLRIGIYVTSRFLD